MNPFVKQNLHGQPNIYKMELMVVESLVTSPSASGSALFRRIADTLADAIGRGDYSVGTRLPPEFALARMFDASRFTVREALGQLRSRGLVVSRRGSGTVVVRRAPQPPAFSEGYRSVDSFLASVAEAPLEALEIRDIIADAALAANLRCGAGRQFLLMRGIRRSRTRPDEPPMALTNAYIDASYSAIRPRLSALTESIAGTAEKYLGVRVDTIVQELEPVALEPETLAQLSAPVGGLAMLVRRWYHLDDGAVLLISRSIYPQGRLPFHTELRRDRD
jgi:GntR family transcriptional regulator